MFRPEFTENGPSKVIDTSAEHSWNVLAPMLATVAGILVDMVVWRHALRIDE
jgi:hypothetical protein